jgi:hypothetical protein
MAGEGRSGPRSERRRSYHGDQPGPLQTISQGDQGYWPPSLTDTSQGVAVVRDRPRPFALGGHNGLPIGMPEVNRRRVMQIAGIGALAASMPLPTAGAAPPSSAYLFHDEFDGPAGSAPDYSKWEPALAREDMEDPTFWELPGNVGQYRDDRRNVFLDGKSNLVFRAAKDGDTYFSGKLFGKYRGPIGTTWEARI